MTTPSTVQDLRDHFAWCIQVLGGVTAASRRLGIDERAIRRFINAERPLSVGLMNDIAKALRVMAGEASEAEAHIVAALNSLDQ
jgi:hypothetical protein